MSWIKAGVRLGVHWYVIMLVCAGVLLSHNAGRLIEAPAVARTKDLEFMPSATTYRLLSCGHTNTIAKLRWIDSFAYIALQMDKRDDAVIGFKRGEAAGGFERLYKALIGLDPYFIEYYYYASLASALGSDNKMLALWAYQTGLIHHPTDVSLWQGLLAEIKMYKGHSPGALNGFLAAWFDHASDENAQRMVLQWKKFHEAATYSGLEKVYFWAQKVNTQASGTTVGDVIEGTLRSRLAEFQCDELNALVLSTERGPTEMSSVLSPERMRAYFKQPVDVSIDVDADVENTLTFELDYAIWGPFIFSDDIFAQLNTVHADGKRRLRAPLHDIQIAHDPYGFAYELREGKVVSPGLERERYLTVIRHCNYYLERQSIQKKRWPKNKEEAIEWIEQHYRLPPPEGVVSYESHGLLVAYPKKDRLSLDLRQRSSLWLSGF